MPGASDQERVDRERLALLLAMKQIASRRLEFTRIHRTHSNQMLRFDDAPYQRELINEIPLGADIMKCVQCGVTETTIPMILAAASSGLGVMVVLPTYDQRGRYVHNRIDRPLEYVDRYRDLLKAAPDEVDNVGLKAFGHGVINFASAETRRSFREIPVDMLVVEEYDECDQENLKLALGRLDHSQYRIVYHIANPTHPDVGIAKVYEQGDKREWHIKCRQCGDEQPLDWFVNVVKTLRDEEGQVIGYELLDPKWQKGSGSDPHIYCRTCASPIDRLERDPAFAFWKPTNTGATRRSYHFSQLFLASVPLRRLVEEFQKAEDDVASMEVFYNERLGLPYAAPGSRLTAEMLSRCVRNYTMPDAAVHAVAGLDIGARFDLRISVCPGGSQRRLVFAGKLRSKRQVRELLDRYNVALVVADARPETHLLEEFQRELEHGVTGYTKDGEPSGWWWRLWRCDFLQGDSLAGVTVDEQKGIVRVDRTSLLDADQQTYIRRQVELPRDAATLLEGEFYDELCKPERLAKKTPSGDIRYVWSKGKDHQRFASAYELLACKIGGFFVPRVETFDREEVHEPAREGEFGCSD